jgi:hypothetical protein
MEQSSHPLQVHFVSVNENDTVSQICDRLFDSFSPNLLIDVSDTDVAASAVRAIGLPLVSANMAHSHPAGIGSHAVVFKSPDRLLIEAARDAISHYDLSYHKVRVLYDYEHGEDKGGSNE